MQDLVNKEKNSIKKQMANKQGNTFFARKLQVKANIAGDYENSSSNSGDSFVASMDSEEIGDLVVVNFNLGKLGYFSIKCFTHEDPKELARKFCKENKIGPKTRA